MGKPTGFKEYDRQLPSKRPISERINDFDEIYQPFSKEKLITQAARCMDCGVATCMAGCPLGNLIPEWNDLVYHKRWKEAYLRLSETNNFPEFTGRLCPAPCEEACVLGINNEPVTIEEIEKQIVEHAFEKGWITPQIPEKRSGKKVAIIGSGPAGLACAQQLNRAGHWVTIFEQDDRSGGLLRYGIPDFKMHRNILERRINLLVDEGITIKTGLVIGKDINRNDLAQFDAVVFCTGASVPRDLGIPGRDLSGIVFAMDFLSQQNRRVADPTDEFTEIDPIVATDKDVIIIGGGDTGSDCVGTALRQKARSVISFQYSDQPPEERPANQPWPYWPMRLRSTSSHEEGGQRLFRIYTKRFVGKDGKITGLETVTLQPDSRPRSGQPLAIVPGSEKIWPADLVILAIGFVGTETNAALTAYGLKLDHQGNIPTNDQYMTAIPGVFAAGDARRGQSLIVRAISEGREAARNVDIFLTGKSDLPGKQCCDLTS
ncbi:MAG: glutamate synthase subunit beta [Desulfobacteraceae bacterium]|jgi:glutamate synthase (NADPH/NADH) small chain